MCRSEHVIQMFLKILTQFLQSKDDHSWKNGLSFICKSFNSAYLTMLCANFGQNWSSDSGLKEVENVSLADDGQRASRKVHLSVTP